MIRKLEVKGLGPINNASVDFANLTIICGKNSVGKTYLSYTHYLLMGRFYKAFEEALAFPTLKAQCDALDVDNADVTRINFELDLYDVNVDWDKIKGEMNSTESRSLISNELRLAQNSEKQPVVDIVIDDSDNFESLIPELFHSSYNGTMLKGGITKEYDSSKLLIAGLLKGNVVIGELYQELDVFVKHFICQFLLKHVHHAITSERTGISLFYRDLDDSMRQSLLSSTGEFAGIVDRKYMKPIEDNISIVRGLARQRFTVKGEKSFSAGRIDRVKEILKELVGGKYTGNDQEIQFQPSHKDDVVISLKTSSGASKSLLLIDDFVHRLANESGMLIYDEPEMNLHLDGQKKIAQLLAALTNIGVKVVVTTHSDHFIREINNLIALSSDKISDERRSELLKMANIKPIALLKPDAVSAVVIDSTTGNTNQMPITESGIEMDLFNEEILASMDISNEIAYALSEGAQD